MFAPSLFCLHGDLQHPSHITLASRCKLRHNICRWKYLFASAGFGNLFPAFRKTSARLTSLTSECSSVGPGQDHLFILWCGYKNITLLSALLLLFVFFSGRACFHHLGRCSSRDELVGTRKPFEWSQQILHGLRENLAVHGVRVPRDGVRGGGAEGLGRREQRLCVQHPAGSDEEGDVWACTSGESGFLLTHVPGPKSDSNLSVHEFMCHFSHFPWLGDVTGEKNFEL